MWCPLVGCTKNNEQKHHGHNNFTNQSSQQGIPTRRMGAVAIGSKACGHIKASLATGNDIEYAGRKNAAQDLRDYVRYELICWKPATSPESDRNCRIEMTAGYMPNRIGHRQHCQSECQRNTKQANAHIWKCSSQYRTSAPAENQPKCPKKLSAILFHVLLLSAYSQRAGRAQRRNIAEAFCRHLGSHFSSIAANNDMKTCAGGMDALLTGHGGRIAINVRMSSLTPIGLVTPKVYSRTCSTLTVVPYCGTAHPVPGNIQWPDILALFRELGAEITEREGSRVGVRLFGDRRVFHRPHPSPDTDKGAIASIRKWLEETGVKP